MPTIEHDPADHRRKVLPDVGTMVRTGGWLGWLSQREELRTEDGRIWIAERRGWKMEKIFVDNFGAPAARWRGAGAFERGGRIELTAGAPSVLLNPSSLWRERYDLVVDGVRAATLHRRFFGQLEVELVDPSADPMLILAAAWLVEHFNEGAGGGTDGD